jgi:hypothetical protein
MVQDFHDSRRKNGEQLRKELAQNEKKTKQETGKMLRDFKSSREKTGAALKKELVAGQVKMKSEVKETLSEARNLIGEFQSTRQKMSEDLKEELKRSLEERTAVLDTMRDGFRKVQKEVKDDLKGASEAWKEMGHDGHKKTSGIKVARTVATETPPNLEEKLLSIINQHPAGITLSDVAKELGIVTIVLGKAAKILLEQGKIRKEEKTYLPAGG